MNKLSSIPEIQKRLSRARTVGEAIAHYSEALRIKPDYAIAHHNLGLVLVQQGKIEEAARHFETALKLNPSYQEARRALDDLANRGKSSGPGTQ